MAFSLALQWLKEDVMSPPATTLPSGSAGLFTPVEIARNEALTTREKLDLLHRLKAEVTGERADPQVLPFSIGDIDAAVEEVRRSAREGTERSFRLPG
jgi:hypothetical protein